eukprot:scaffold5744_cov179-Ochromonas_danica.AAC.9
MIPPLLLTRIITQKKIAEEEGKEVGQEVDLEVTLAIGNEEIDPNMIVVTKEICLFIQNLSFLITLVNPSGYSRDYNHSAYNSGSFEGGNGGSGGSGGMREGGFNKTVNSDPVSTIIIKGLPNHTTEPTLFVFSSHFDERLVTVKTLPAGSTGDPNAPQLIIENRAVGLDYARESMTDRRKDTARPNDRKFKGDWLCDACGCHNFAKRDVCFRCNQPRTERAIVITPANEPFGDSAVASDTPTSSVVVRGFPPLSSEEQLNEVFRQFAVVKECTIVRDPTTLAPKGLAFVQFHSVDHAVYALQGAQTLQVEGNSLRVAYAKEHAMRQLLAAQRPFPSGMPLPIMPMAGAPLPGMLPNPVASALTASAMQAAQWSLNNGFAGLTSAPPMMPTAHPVMTAPPVPAKPLWPPLFETHGSAYIFQVKSGYFLEPHSECYYCPKSKLYYSARNGVYYRYDPSIDPPFRRFDPPQPIEPEDKPAPAAVAAEISAVAESTVRQPVSLSLGGVMKAKAKGVAPNKKVLQDMAKWEAAQKEEEEPEEEIPSNVNSAFGKRVSKAAVTAAPPVAPSAVSALLVLSSEEVVNSVSSSGSPPNLPTAAISSNVVSSSANKIVCTLCRRQFPSAEVLARHEKESKLHAENLAKAQKQQKSSTSQYRDRAEERREMFGSVADHVRKAPSPLEPIASTARSVVESAPPVPLTADESNPGNVMLRKMGWKVGQGLGKDGDGIVDAIGVNDNKESSAILSTLRATSGEGSHHKDNRLAATRARYEQVSKEQQ